MNTLDALTISVRAAVAACTANSSAPDDDAFMRGFAAAHRKLGAFLAGSLDRALVPDDVMKDAFIAHVETLRDAATDPARREFLHRLLGSVRKV